MRMLVLLAHGTAAGYAFTPSSSSLSSSSSPCRIGVGGIGPLHRQNHLLTPRTKTKISPRLSRLRGIISPDNNNNDLNSSYDNGSSICWNTNLRKQLGILSAIGTIETAYLTYDKLTFSSGGATSSLVSALCTASDNNSGSSSSSCGDILHGPYSSFHLGGTLDVPLSSLGMIAYMIIFVLAIQPLFMYERIDDNRAVLDSGNRIALLGGTTLMASFSMYLVTILVGVLHTSCLFCFISAGLSTSMAALSWFGGMLPSFDELQLSMSRSKGVDIESISTELIGLRKKGVIVGAASVGVATVMALGLFLNVADESYSLAASSSSPLALTGSNTLLASSSDDSSNRFQKNVPPRITSKSSATALTLATDLKLLNSRMYGAFWCSHCYDQKQAFGYEAMRSIPYVECDREGYNNERDVCKAREVPGYPTWEIGGKLYPGERSLDELREIVNGVMSGK